MILFKYEDTINALQADKESMRSVRYQPGYEVTFSLLNPQPDILKVTWDIKGAIAGKRTLK